MRYCILGLIFILAAMGCSSSGDAITPDNPRDAVFESSRNLLGLFQFRVSPAEERIEIIPMRTADLHLNAVPLLEPSPPIGLFIGLQGPVVFNAHSVKCNIKLEHPITGDTRYPGFDVRGILIGAGSVHPSYDQDVLMAGANQPHLTNADGYTRWWNPTEFPVNPGNVLGYTDGFLGSDYSGDNFSATVNGYKYFADGLAPDDDVSILGPTSRGFFSPGSTNIRHYDIEFGTGDFIFNYAVDASWQHGIGTPPYTIPDDFPPGANCPEAWYVTTQITDNQLWNDGSGSGGSLALRVKVYDHYSPEENTVRVQSTGNFNTQAQTIPVETGDGYSIYEFSVAAATPAEGSIQLFITVENPIPGYGGFIPGKFISSYFTNDVSVSTYNPAVDDDLRMSVSRSDYYPPGAALPNSWISSINLDWGDLPNAAQYAVYRSSLWADPYGWVLVGTTDSSTTEWVNDTTGPHAIDWDEDYIYEVRPRSVPNDMGSEGGPTERAYIVMETNDDDLGVDPLNPRWVSKYGAGGKFKFFYGGTTSCDEGSKIKGMMKFTIIDNDSWEIAYCPNPLPDVPGLTNAFVDFAFSTQLGYPLPAQAGFTWGSMTQPPVQDALNCVDFFNVPFVDFLEGQPYNNNNCPGITQHFGGDSKWAYSGQSPLFRGAQYKIDKLIEPEYDYIGFGIASYNAAATTSLDLAIDSVAVWAY